MRSFAEKFGPVGEVIEGARVGVVEMKGSDGDFVRKNCSIVCIGADSFDYFLFPKPVVGAATGILAGLEDIASDFGRLASEADLAVPILGHVDVEKEAGREALIEDHGDELADPFCGRLA